MFIILYNIDLFAISNNFKKCSQKLLKLLCTRKPANASLKRLTKGEDGNNATKHTGLLLATANEQSTAPGDTRLTLTMGTLGTSHWTVISHR